MVCPSCGRDVPSSANSCPRCGLSLHREAIAPRTSRATHVLGVAMIIGTLAGIAYLARIGSRDDQMHNAGTADVAFDLAAASPATERTLGLPIRGAGPPRGQVRLHEHGGYAQGVIPVMGPK